MKPFWVSWYATGPFTWDGPWWPSALALLAGIEGGRDVICAAVMATDADDAKRQIREAHDMKIREPAWRFCAEKPEGWEPFCGRFPRGEWMKWPWPVPAATES